MSSIFFINPLGYFDPKRPIPFGKSPHTEPTWDREEPEENSEKPERPLSNYDDIDLEDDCLVCGEQIGVHSRNDICNCMSKGGF